MIQLKRTLFRYFKVKTQLLLLKIVSIQAERLPYANLYAACQFRDGYLDNFFCMKIFCTFLQYQSMESCECI